MDSRIKWLLGIVGGALLGLAYYYLVGCRTGTCPLTSNPYTSSLYGALLGGLIFFPHRRKHEK